MKNIELLFSDLKEVIFKFESDIAYHVSDAILIEDRIFKVTNRIFKISHPNLVTLIVEEIKVK